MLQRVLGGHSQIATVSEPWLLLPFLSTMREEGTYADYRMLLALKGIQDFYEGLPGGKGDYLSEIRTFVLRLYKRHSHKEAIYFLDKTPRYHLIIDQIMEVFPEAKVIFLWRNPLSIIASILNSFDHKWELYRLQIDLFQGIRNLTTGFEKYRERSWSLNYETFLQNPEKQLKLLLEYLELSEDTTLIHQFNNVNLDGRLGDQTGIKAYDTLSTDTFDKWKFELQNPARKKWCKNYLRWIGVERLKLQGYDYDQLCCEIDKVPVSLRYLGSDLLHMSLDPFYRFMEPHIVKKKYQKIADGSELIYAHL